MANGYIDVIIVIFLSNASDLTKADLRQMAEKLDGGGLFFDFGTHELTVMGINTWKALSDDIGFI